MELHIATGNKRKSRKTLVWKNIKTTWPAMVKRLSTTLRTLEKYAEYCAYGKETQADIKDHGGFVGGYLRDGKRSPQNVTFRQILTLDLDFATLDFWDNFTMFYDVAAVCHSTHKHSKRSPRFRLVLPLDRQVSREEYEAIARKIAGTLDINIFDPTTFQPERLMYWPTTAQDGEYFFKEQKGAWLNADEILASYFDWTDISAWPKPDSEKDLIHGSLKKQGDPNEKPGLIGAFCRSYNVHQAIETYLSDVYEPTDFEDRYTYSEGSAAAGAIVYNDGDFLYSHHGTDPIHGQLVNAFDLVRLHLFGHEDTDQGEKEITKKKSYKLMTDFAASIPQVVQQIGVKNLGFDDEYDTKWLGNLTVDKYGKYENTIPNFYTILANDPGLKGQLQYDQFNQREVVFAPVPWNDTDFGACNFTDKDSASLREYLERVYGVYHATKYKDALDMVFNKNTFHPVKQYLEAQTWDGEQRVDSVLIDYLGAEDTLFNRQATRKTLAAAVARIYQPGVKFDYVLTLVGKQGIGKSSLFNTLGVQWFSDSFMGVDGTKAFEQLHGVWIMEVAELAGFKRAEVEAVKHFISKQTDSFRVAYGDKKSDFPRQNIFVATSNADKPLNDYTGGRRYWPVPVTGFGTQDLCDMPVGQIWAEAVLIYKAGEKLYFDAVTEQTARDIQSEHTEVDDRAGLIEEYLQIPLPVTWPDMTLFERRNYLGDKNSILDSGEVERLSVCVAEIWSELFREDTGKMGPHNTKYIHQILSGLPGWEKAKSNLTFPLYGKQRAYVVSENVKKHNKRKAVRK